MFPLKQAARAASPPTRAWSFEELKACRAGNGSVDQVYMPVYISDPGLIAPWGGLCALSKMKASKPAPLSLQQLSSTSTKLLYASVAPGPGPRCKHAVARIHFIHASTPFLSATEAGPDLEEEWVAATAVPKAAQARRGKGRVQSARRKRGFSKLTLKGEG